MKERFQCPFCAYVVEGLEVEQGQTHPLAGELFVCVSCWVIGIFQDDLSLRVASTEECEEVPEWVRHKIAQQESSSIPS